MPAEMPSSSILHASNAYIGAGCEKQNAAFMACKNANGNPAACLAEGDAATQCAVNM